MNIHRLIKKCYQGYRQEAACSEVTPTLQNTSLDLSIGARGQPRPISMETIFQLYKSRIENWENAPLDHLFPPDPLFIPNQTINKYKVISYIV